MFQAKNWTDKLPGTGMNKPGAGYSQPHMSGALTQDGDAECYVHPGGKDFLLVPLSSCPTHPETVTTLGLNPACMQPLEMALTKNTLALLPCAFLTA